MSGRSLVHIKDSIAVQLLKIVFGIYLGVMLIATLTHITAEYHHVKNRTVIRMKQVNLLWEKPSFIPVHLSFFKK